MVTLRELPDAQVEAKRNEHSIVHIVKAVTRRSFKPVVSIVTGAILLFFMLQYYPQGDIFLQPFCSLKPVKTYLSSCQQEPIPNFSHLIKVQESLYENVLSAQANNAEVMSTLDLKRVELAARDIQVTVKYSNLVSADLLYDKLGEYLVRSRQLGRDIQILQARTKGVIDNLITYNTFTLRKLSNINARRMNRQELRAIYDEVMALVEREANRLILAIENAQSSLAHLEEDLNSIHEISVQEQNLQKAERPHFFVEMINMIRGKGLQRPLIEENIQLLTNFDAERAKAATQLMVMLNAMEAFQMDLEELRARVVEPLVAPELIPLEVHIENIGRAVERLKQTKVIAWKNNQKIEQGPSSSKIVVATP